MKFAFVIHPLSIKQITERYRFLKPLPVAWIEELMRSKARKPKVLSEIKGIKSSIGTETEGIFILCPMTPRMMIEKLPLEEAYDNIAACGHVAEREGAEIIGLGAFTSVVGDGGISVAQRCNIAVTSGNSYTTATAIEGALKACELVGIILERSTLGVVGATGSIGKICAQILAPKFNKTILVGRDLERTKKLEKDIIRSYATNRIDALKEADLVVTVTSSDTEIITPDCLKSGAIVSDVSRPRDVSLRVSKERPDVLVIEGGVVAVPGNVDFGFDFGFPEKTAYACMSETILLALEERAENFTLGRNITESQVNETWEMAEKHGFKLAGLRSFEKSISQDRIEYVKQVRAKKYS